VPIITRSGLERKKAIAEAQLFSIVRLRIGRFSSGYFVSSEGQGSAS